MATPEELQAEIERLRAENEALKTSGAKRIYLKVSDKGAVSLYGLARFPTTLYVEQWETVLGMSDEIKSFLTANSAKLKRKGA